MNSDGDKLYMRIVDLDEIYNFVVQTFFIWSHLSAQIIDKCSYRQLNWRQRVRSAKKKIEVYIFEKSENK